MSITALVSSLPKAEVHTHLEFSLPIERSYEIAKRNGIQLGITLDECLDKHKNLKNLTGLLEVMLIVSKALIYEQDFYELVMSYYKSCYESGVVYCEPTYFVYLFHNERTGINTVMNGLWRAIQEAETTYGIKSNFLLSIGRRVSAAENVRYLNLAKQHQEKIKGLTLTGDEIKYPTRLSKSTFELAYNLGLTGPNEEFIAVHTGEEASPEHIIESLHHINVGRVDHGVRAWEDPSLVRMFSQTQMPLAMCPLSNKSLKVLDRFCGDHYVYNSFLDAGCLVSINTDGPHGGGGSMIDNYNDFIDHNHSLGERELESKIIQLAKNSFESSFLGCDEKKYYINDIERIVEVYKAC